MYMSSTIGLAIITCEREKFLKKLLKSIDKCDYVDHVVIVNDGNYPLKLNTKHGMIHPGKHSGVAKAKNAGLKHLMEAGCDHLFLMEDDMIVKDKNVFNKYIDMSKQTGIQHLNFCLHGEDNKRSGKPAPKLIVDYGETRLALYHNVYGSLSYYTREVIETVGYMDEDYYNAMEHVDHTMAIIKAGYHPAFRWFADLEDSNKLIDEQDTKHQESKIRSDSEWLENFKKGIKLFHDKHDVNVCSPQQAVESKQQVLEQLKTIKNESC